MEQDFVARIINFADEHGFSDQPTLIGVGGLSIARSRKPSELMNTLYKPLLCLVLQGKKETRFGDKAVTFSTGDTLIVSIDIPTVSQIMVASSEKPYVCLAIEIDLNIIREIQAEMQINNAKINKDTSIASGIAGKELFTSMQRLFDLHTRSAIEQKVLAPLIQREIHFRMLYEGHSGMLHRLSSPDSHASRINLAILKLQQDFAKPISVPELASLANMSLSSFHEHFKAMTATSPLQYLKDLRLHKAQQKLRASNESVSTIGFDVGYESPTQFSREYTRKFGYPPSHKR